MRRIVGIGTVIAFAALCLTANADTYRKGQDPIAGYAAMYCSTLTNMTMMDPKTINAPEGYRIACFDIWCADTTTARLTVYFYDEVGGDGTNVEVNMYSEDDIGQESLWFWSFPVSCDRVQLSPLMNGADWCACVYLMRYGKGAGNEGVLHPWHNEP